MVYKNIIYAIIGFILIFRFPILSFRIGYQQLFLYGVVSIFAFLLIQRKYLYPGLFLLLALFASHYPLTTISSRQSLYMVLAGVLVYFCLVESKLNSECLYNVICVYCLIHIVFLTLQHFNINPYVIYGMRPPDLDIGMTANSNEASALIALSTPCFFRNKWFYAIPILILGLYFSKALGGILSFSLILAAFCILHGHKFSGIMIFCLILIGAYNFIGSDSVTYRAGVWLAAMKLYFTTTPIEIGSNITMEKSWLTGFGIGHWSDISKACFKYAYINTWFDRAHNTFIHSFFEMGIAFPVLLGFYVKRVIKQAKDNNTFIFALIAIIISCSVNSAFRINFLNGFIMLTYLAIIESEWRNRTIKRAYE